MKLESNGFFVAVLIVVGFAGCPGILSAQSNLSAQSPWSYSDLEGRWFLDLGLEVEREPTFPGSDDAEVEAMPELQLTRRIKGGHQIYLGLGEIGAKLRISNRAAVLLSAGIEEGRDASEDQRLLGLDPIEDGFDLAVAYFTRRGSWVFGTQVQSDVGNDKGTVFFIGGGWEVESAARRWRTSLTLDLSGADTAHMRTEFGVTAAEAARTEFPEFQPGAGLKTATMGLEVDRWFGKWGLLAALEGELYLGDARDSPLIRQLGRNVGIEASIGLTYRWNLGPNTR